MRYILFILLFPFVAQGQDNKVDTIYYGINEIVESVDSAYSVRYFNFDSISNRYKFEEWRINTYISHGNDLIQKGELKSIDPEIKDGEFYHLDEFGNSVTFLYADNNFVDIVEYRNDEELPIEPVYSFYMVDKPTNLENGLNEFHKLLAEEVILDEETKMDFIGEKLYLRCILEKDGSTSNITIIKGLNNSLDSKIKDAFAKLTFIPSMHKGEYVKMSMILPIEIK